MHLLQPPSNRLADRTAARVAAMLDRPDFVALAAAVIARANRSAASLADLALAAELTRLTRTLTAPLGLAPSAAAVDQDRIAHNLGLQRDRDPAGPVTSQALLAARLARLRAYTRSEPLLTVADTVQTGLVERDLRWVRVTAADPCELCQGWADGIPRPASAPMARHRGCSCTQSPVL